MAARTVRPFEGHRCTTGIHNALLDAVLPEVSPAAWKVLCFIIRQTEGWDREEQGLSYADMMRGTGLSREAVWNALKSLKPYGLLIIESGNTSTSSKYKINRNCEIEWAPQNYGSFAVKTSAEGGSKTEPPLVRKSNQGVVRKPNHPSSEIEPGGSSEIEPGGGSDSELINRNRNKFQKQVLEERDARANVSGDLNGPGDAFEPTKIRPTLVSKPARPTTESLASEFTPVEKALCQAVGWRPDTLDHNAWYQIKNAAKTISHHEDATPERISRAPDFYRSQRKYSYAPGWIARDWRQIANWLELIESEGNGNAITQPARTPPPRETHNARAARETLALIRQAQQEAGGGDELDPADAAPAGLALDRGRT